MNGASKKPIRRIAILAVVFLAAPAFLFFGPLVIHACYRALTSEATMQQQRAEYRRLDQGEAALTGASKTNSQKARHKLFLWFHARGFPIDEGDEEYSLWRPWVELLDYWRGDDGARYISNSTNDA